MHRHHFSADVLFHVDVLLNGNKVYAERRILDLWIVAGIDMVASETGQVFYNDCSDLAVFHHSFHLVKTRSVKGCTRNPIFCKEAVVYDPVLMTVFFKDLLWSQQWCRFSFRPFRSFFLFSRFIPPNFYLRCFCHQEVK